jgi:iron(III) transport system permease protein
LALETAALPASAWAERADVLRALARWLWSGALLAALAFLVLYPVAMLLLGALTNTNPVVDGLGVLNLSLGNFLSVLGNPNVHEALLNSLLVCTGGTALAVAIGLTFSWIVVRTNTPLKRVIGAASMIPLFVPPSSQAWRGRSSAPRSPDCSTRCFAGRAQTGASISTRWRA